MRPCSPEAYKLFHEASVALANVEANGMRIDTDYLETAIESSEKEIRRKTKALQEDQIYAKQWKRRFGAKSNLTSGDQLATIVFDVLGYACRERTPTGKPSASDTNLADVDLPFVIEWRSLQKLIKAKGTFLEGIQRFVTSDGLLHPNFNLNIAASYRSTSNDPNFQNFPVRNEEMARLVRSAFIPRKNHVLIECDFSGIEVGIACCYNKDPNLIHDFTVGDMHRDMAAECFMLLKDQVTKMTRYCGKNMFVFPQFYGDYYISCAMALWDAITRMQLETVDGVPMLEHLKSKGVRKLGACDPDQTPKSGTFEAHLKAVENRFWNERYQVYTQWKKTTWEQYQEKGYTSLYTGFVCSRDSDGFPLNRKQAINYRIQGTAFHCLLWCLVRMNSWLVRNKMRSKVVSQIHDSIIMDVHKDELSEVVEKANTIMSKKLPQHWKWINVPLKTEVEACGVGETWFDKKKLTLT